MKLHQTHRGQVNALRLGAVVAASALLLSLVCASADAGQRRQRNNEPVIKDAPYPPYTGLKNTVAVTKFDAHGAFVAHYGGWNIGGGMAAMLASELTMTNHFIVLDRTDLNDVLKEQELKLSNLTSTVAPRAGELLGAQFLVRGSVTEFSEAQSGGGFTAAFSSSRFIPALGRRSNRGHVTIDLRLIDTTTGQIVLAETVDQELKSKSTAFELRFKNSTIGGDAFKKSALGTATRAAIREAVQLIVDRMRKVRWQAMVASVNGDRIYINAGANANLSPGVTLNCQKTTNRILDPITGAVLGSEHTTTGQITIEEVAPRYSVGRFVGAAAPQTGDLVFLAAGTPRMSYTN